MSPDRPAHLSDLAAGSVEAPLATLAPRLRDDVRVGPGLWGVGKRLYTLHDPRTGWYFRVREHEHFLAKAMDGTTTISEMEQAFEVRFNRRLADSHWESIL